MRCVLGLGLFVLDIRILQHTAHNIVKFSLREATTMIIDAHEDLVYWNMYLTR